MSIASSFVVGTSGIIESSKRFPETTIADWSISPVTRSKDFYTVILYTHKPIKVVPGMLINFRLRFRQGREEGFPTIPAQVFEVKGNKITLHLKSLPDPILEV